MVSVSPGRAGHDRTRDLATTIRDGLVESDAEGGWIMALTRSAAEGI